MGLRDACAPSGSTVPVLYRLDHTRLDESAQLLPKLGLTCEGFTIRRWLGGSIYLGTLGCSL